jgi:hypothetical protein
MFRANIYSYLHTVHIVQSSSAQKPCLPHQQDIIPYVVKISVLRSWRWVNVCPKHVELILEINKTVIVASSWCSILLYLISSFFFGAYKTEIKNQNFFECIGTKSVILKILNKYYDTKNVLQKNKGPPALSYLTQISRLFPPRPQ